MGPGQKVVLTPAWHENAWLQALRRYAAFIVPAHLLWELGHLPLYTIWREGSPGEIVFAALHCTGGDALIAIATLTVALLLAGARWPIARGAYWRVAAVTILLGVGYTAFSEWLNRDVRQAWAYSELMPVVPFFDTGLSPLLQWIVIPLGAFWWARRPIIGIQQPREARA